MIFVKVIDVVDLAKNTLGIDVVDAVVEETIMDVVVVAAFTAQGPGAPFHSPTRSPSLFVLSINQIQTRTSNIKGLYWSRKTASSSAIISASVLEWLTAPGFFE